MEVASPGRAAGSAPPPSAAPGVKARQGGAHGYGYGYGPRVGLGGSAASTAALFKFTPPPDAAEVGPGPLDDSIVLLAVLFSIRLCLLVQRGEGGAGEEADACVVAFPHAPHLPSSLAWPAL